MVGIIAIYNEKNAVKKAIKGMNIVKYKYHYYSFSDGKKTIHSPDFKILNGLLKEYECSNVLMYANNIVEKIKQPIENKFVADCEIYNWKELKKKYLINAKNDVELLYRLISENGLSVLEEIDGVYAFVYFDDNRIIAGRDILGVKSLCINFKNNCLEFASENKVLNYKGELINPREIYVFENNELLINKIDFWKFEKVLDDEEIIVKNLIKKLELAVKKRISSEKTGILFSGGIDSLVLAFIMKKLGKDFKLYTAGTKNSEDVKWAKETAKWLNVDLTIIEKEDIVDDVKKIIKIIETDNFVKVSVALPFYLATEKAKEDKIKMIFTGLGSEEIFAGYLRHEKSENINEECLEGLKMIYERDLYRDNLIMDHFEMKVKLPFLDKYLVKYSLGIPENYKIVENVKKYILRKAALEMGIPEKFAFRKKKAAQYGSNYNNLLAKLAKKNGFVSKREFVSSLK